LRGRVLSCAEGEYDGAKKLGSIGGYVTKDNQFQELDRYARDNEVRINGYYPRDYLIIQGLRNRDEGKYPEDAAHGYAIGSLFDLACCRQLVAVGVKYLGGQPNAEPERSSQLHKLNLIPGKLYPIDEYMAAHEKAVKRALGQLIPQVYFAPTNEVVP
jgi:hypothetical protein